MRKTVLTFGIIAGLIVVAMMFITIPLYKSGALKIDAGEIVGYTTMIIAMSMIFFGIKSYRDNRLNGAIKFGTALQLGVLIAGIASIMYVIGWEIDYHFFNPDFMEMYGRAMIKKAQESNASVEKMKEIKDQILMMEDAYGNIFKRMGLTLLEILPVGLLIALISATILRKKEMLPV
jgi:hypothetical protein